MKRGAAQLVNANGQSAAGAIDQCPQQGTGEPPSHAGTLVRVL